MKVREEWPMQPKDKGRREKAFEPILLLTLFLPVYFSQCLELSFVT